MQEDISNEKITLTHAGNDGVFLGHIFVCFFLYFLVLFGVAFLFFTWPYDAKSNLFWETALTDETDLKSILPV